MAETQEDTNEEGNILMRSQKPVIRGKAIEYLIDLTTQNLSVPMR